MEENKMNEINEKIKSDLTTLFSSMKKDLILFYFFRNNSRFTNRYYYRFISVIGAETYHSLDSVKYEWESARYSFDKMYGLVAAWKDNSSFISDNLFEKELKNLQTAVNELSDEIKKMNGSELVTEEYIDKIKSSGDLSVCESAINCYHELQNTASEINKDAQCDTQIQNVIRKVTNNKKYLEIIRRNNEMKNS